MVCLRGGERSARSTSDAFWGTETDGSEGTSFQVPRFLVSRARANSKDRTGAQVRSRLVPTDCRVHGGSASASPSRRRSVDGLVVSLSRGSEPGRAGAAFRTPGSPEGAGDLGAARRVRKFGHGGFAGRSAFAVDRLGHRS